MKFLSPAACPFCSAKDEIIARLDKRVDELEKTMLSMVDPKAYTLRYPRERTVTTPQPPMPARPASPAQVRAQAPYEAPLTQEQLEQTFEEIR